MVTVTPVALTSADYPGAEGSYWAEPSIEHAVTILRDIYAEPNRAVARSMVGFQQLQEKNSFEAVGHSIRETVHIY